MPLRLPPPECDCSPAETELLDAMQEYKRSSGRLFPTWSEVLEVARSLGYEKGAACGPLAALPPPERSRAGGRAR